MTLIRWIAFAPACVVAIAIPLHAPVACACHGPGTAAGGVHVWSARPTPIGSFAFTLRADYTEFESLSPAEIETMTLQVSGDHQHVHVIDRSVLTTLAMLYGVSESFELAATVGYYGANGVGEGHGHGGSSYSFDDYGRVDGVADSWLVAKLGVHSSSKGDVALIGGIKASTGVDDISFDGAPIDQALQPGSGSVDATAAVAYTRDFGDRFTLDASTQYVFRTEANGYDVGDQMDVGVALGARLPGDVRSSRRFDAFLEVTSRYQMENEEDGDRHVNSGGSWLFVSPGVRGDVFSWLSAMVSVQLPVVQDLNDVQQEVDYKVTAALSVSL